MKKAMRVINRESPRPPRRTKLRIVGVGIGLALTFGLPVFWMKLVAPLLPAKRRSELDEAQGWHEHAERKVA